MITAFIEGQWLHPLKNICIVSDTIDYLTAQFCFSTADWSAMTNKFAHFSKGDEVYDVELINNRIEKDAHLNLSAGEWSLWLHGIRSVDGETAERITTNIITFNVSPTGMTDTDNAFPSVAPDMVEQIYASLEGVAAEAVNEAIPSAVEAALAQAKASGEFDGKDGKDGINGKTPVKGEDYFTDADKAELVEEVLEEVGGKQVQPDWNQNDDTQPDYVHNRTHWVDYTEGDIIPELTYTVMEEDPMFPITEELPPLVVGQEYTVNWNGTEYKCTAQAYVENNIEGGAVLGNIGALTGGEMSEEPFVIAILYPELAAEMGAFGMIVALDGTTSGTVSVRGMTEVVHQLPERFIPTKLIKPNAYIITLPADAQFGTDTDGNPSLTINDVYDDFVDYLLDGRNIWVDLINITGTPNRRQVVTWDYDNDSGLDLYVIYAAAGTTKNMTIHYPPNGTIPLG